MIICSQCKQLKNETDFYGRGDGSTKKKSRCKSCDNAAKHQYYLKNNTKIRKKIRKWYKNNKNKIKTTQQKYNNTPKGRAVKLLKAAQSRAVKYNYEFKIDTKYILSMWEEQDSKCALTKIPFEMENKTQYNSNPYGPSIDRIDSSKGYIPGNVRLVCTAVNYALNEFGEQTFEKICRAYLNTISC